MPALSHQRRVQIPLEVDEVVRRHGVGFGETLFADQHQNSPLIACAPRLTVRVYSSLLNYTAHQTRGVCYALPHPALLPSTLPTPFEKDSSLRGGKFVVSSHDNTGWAQAGFSVVEHQNVTYIGGVNAYFNQGVVARVKIGERSLATKYSDGGSEFDDMHEGWSMALGRYDGRSMALAVSAPGASEGAGAINFYNATTLVPLEVPEITGSALSAKFGHAVAACDVDGDGADDLVVSAPFLSQHLLPDAGALHVYYSPATQVAGRLSQVVAGGHAWGHLGLALTCADLDQDHFYDVVAAAPHGALGGTIHVYPGTHQGLAPRPSQVIHASDLDVGLRGFGASLSGGLDVDDNGYPDILVGAPGSDAAVLIRSSGVLGVEGLVEVAGEGVASLDGGPVVKVGPRCDQECFTVILKLDLNQPLVNASPEVAVTLTVDAAWGRFAFTESQTNKLSFYIPSGTSRQRSSFPVFLKTADPLLSRPVHIHANVSLHQPHPSPSLLQYIPAAPLDAISLVPPNSNTEALNSLPEVPTVLRVNPTGLSAIARLTCTSRPDLSISVAPTQVVLGEITQLMVRVTVKEDSACEISFDMIIPGFFTFRQVLAQKYIPLCSVLEVEDVDEGSKNNERKVSEKVELTEKESGLKEKNIRCLFQEVFPAESEILVTLELEHSSGDLFNYLIHMEQNTPATTASSPTTATAPAIPTANTNNSDKTIFSSGDVTSSPIPNPMSNSSASPDARPVASLVHLSAHVSAASPDPRPDDNVFQMVLPVSYQHNTLALGSAEPEIDHVTANESLSISELTNPVNRPSHTSARQLGPLLTHHYHIVVPGPSPLLDAKVVLRAPWFTLIGDLPVLYLTKGLATTPPLRCTGPPANPLNLNLMNSRESEAVADEVEIDNVEKYIPELDEEYEDNKESEGSLSPSPTSATVLPTSQIHRRRRQASEGGMIKPDPMSSAGGLAPTGPGSFPVLSCGDVQCREFVCALPVMEPGDSVSLAMSAHLVASVLQWVPTTGVTIRTTLELETSGFRPSQRLVIASASTLIKINREKKVEEAGLEAWLDATGWWWILASVLGGAIILLFIIAVLYNCGFFKRRSNPYQVCPEQLEKGGEAREAKHADDAMGAEVMDAVIHAAEDDGDVKKQWRVEEAMDLEENNTHL